MHGFSLNVNNDLSQFNYITPCGIQGAKITSVKELLSERVNIEEVYDKLVNHYSDVFHVHMLPVEMKAVVQRIGSEKIYDSVVPARVGV